MKIVLEEADFRDLVNGRAVKLHRSVDVALADIGWQRMLGAIVDAMAERGLGLADVIRLTAQSQPPQWPKGEDDGD